MLLRLAKASTLAVVALVILATPAWAHGRGSDATNYRSTVTATSDLPGVGWRIYGGDELLQLTNTSDTEVLVYGYAEDEPYLRVGPDGVFENRNAAATYENEDRYAEVTIPVGVDLGGPPDWEQVSDGHSHAWHDHRVHWMARALPPSVTDTSTDVVVYEQWSVPFAYGDEQLEVLGRLDWIAGPSPLPWLAAALLLTLPALAGVRGHSPQNEHWERRLVRPAALVLGAVALLNVTHLVDDLFAVPVDVTTRALAAGQTAMFLAIGAFGAWRAWRADDGAFTALGVGSGAVLVGQGLLYLAVLTASQNASLFPEALSRLTVAVSLVQVLPVGAVAVIGTRALLPPREDEVPLEGAQEARA